MESVQGFYATFLPLRTALATDGSTYGLGDVVATSTEFLPLCELVDSEYITGVIRNHLRFYNGYLTMNSRVGNYNGPRDDF